MAEFDNDYSFEQYADRTDDVRVIPDNIEDICGVHDDHNEGYFVKYLLFYLALLRIT